MKNRKVKLEINDENSQIIINFENIENAVKYLLNKMDSNDLNDLVYDYLKNNKSIISDYLNKYQR